MEGTIELLDKNPGRTGKPSAASQATALQIKISELIKQPGLQASALASLSEQWLKLEHFKRCLKSGSAPWVRQRKNGVSAAGSTPPPPPPPNSPSPGQSTMREPDEPPTETNQE